MTSSTKQKKFRHSRMCLGILKDAQEHMVLLEKVSPEII
jgi:hypothetical protein